MWLSGVWKDALSGTGNYEFEFMATSVTLHSQGVELNTVLNCGFRKLERDKFFRGLFCWEGKVKAWVRPNMFAVFEEAAIDIFGEAGVVHQCWPDEKETLQTCVREEGTAIKSDINSKLPGGDWEVPLIKVDGKRVCMPSLLSFQLRGKQIAGMFGRRASARSAMHKAAVMPGRSGLPEAMCRPSGGLFHHEPCRGRGRPPP
mmetsp:Transcript_106572/g.301479  ORF Transcript_106572/g.301479 Transcript_106572/m.301479 type:complete len:202 (+) Transcript_106572:219-824(+)